MNRRPKHPPRLTPFQSYGQPIWFVTFGTFGKSSVLANIKVHNQFKLFAEKHSDRGVTIGKYVIMPDHIHLFIRISSELKLGATIGFLKKSLSVSLKQNGISLPHWQPSFFDHMVRNSESYAKKWHYVYLNPVRAGLVNKPDDWLFSGQVVPLHF